MGVRIAALALFAALAAGAARAEESLPADVAAARLAEAAAALERFDALYEIRQCGAPAGTVRVRFEAPNRLRIDGHRKSSVAIALDGARAQYVIDGKLGIADCGPLVARVARVAAKVGEMRGGPPEPVARGVAFSISASTDEGGAIIPSTKAGFTFGTKRDVRFGLPDDWKEWTWTASRGAAEWRLARGEEEVVMAVATGTLVRFRVRHAGSGDDDPALEVRLASLDRPEKPFDGGIYELDGEAQEDLSRQLFGIYERPLLAFALRALGAGYIAALPPDAPKERVDKVRQLAGEGYRELLQETVVGPLAARLRRRSREALLATIDAECAKVGLDEKSIASATVEAAAAGDPRQESLRRRVEEFAAQCAAERTLAVERLLEPAPK